MKKSSFYRSTNRKMFLIFFLPVIILVIIADYGFTKLWMREEVDYYCQIMDVGIERVDAHLKNGDTTMARDLLDRYMFISDSENMFYDKDGNFIVGQQVPEFIKDVKDLELDKFILKRNRGRYYVIFAHQSPSSGSYMVVYSSAEPLFRHIFIQCSFMLLMGGLAVVLSMFMYRKWLSPKIKKMIMAKERMETELDIAHNVQQYMVPDSEKLNMVRNSQVFGYLKPAREVGGDLYNYVLVDKADEQGQTTPYLYFCIGDISDKGTPAALMMAIHNEAFCQQASSGLPLKNIITNMNNSISNDNRSDMFCTMFAACLNMNTGDMEFINAGHDKPVLNGDFIAAKHNRPIGITPNYDFQVEHLQLHPNDVLFLYTDGITEAKTNDNRFFGNERLLESLHSAAPNDDIKQISERVIADVNAFVGDAEQFDDMTILTLKFNV